MPGWTVVYEAAFWPLLLVLVVACWRWGDTAVRATATIMTVGMLATWLLEAPVRNRDYESGQALADLGMLIAFVWISARTPRRWLMIVAALQFLSVGGHLAKAMQFEMSRMAYAILHASQGYPQLVLLSIGLLIAIQTHRSVIAPFVTDWPGDTTRGTGERSGR